MKATFLSPPNVQITQARGRMKAHPLSHIDDAEVNAIHASGADTAAGDFRVIITLQKSPAPEVRTVGGSVKVGERVASFEGGRIVIK